MRWRFAARKFSLLSWSDIFFVVKEFWDVEDAKIVVTSKEFTEYDIVTVLREKPSHV